MPPSIDHATILDPHRDHSRLFQTNRFVYPVLSRRSRGISVGVNLNPDKVCNFDCVYCQVDRRSEAVTTFVETERLLAEVEECLELTRSGKLFEDERFRGVPEPLRRLNDIAFSGDGEPTSFRNFDEIVRDVAAIKRRLGLNKVKLILITNASLFHREHVRNALEIMDVNQGEIWAKLDAGTEEYYRKVERTKVPFQRVLDNLLLVSRRRPIVIQSLFMTIDGVGPSKAEIRAYVVRLEDILYEEGEIERVQIYTVARPPAESNVGPLSEAELREIARRVYGIGINAEVFGGV